MVTSNHGNKNHPRVHPPPTILDDFNEVINAWSWPLLCGYAVHWTARWGFTTCRRRWGWWCLLAEMGMTFRSRTCWRCFLSHNFHELHVNVQWWSLSAYLKVKSGEKWLQVPQSSISLKFDLHPFCWRNVRTTPQVHRILEEAKLPEVSEAERRPQCEEMAGGWSR